MALVTRLSRLRVLLTLCLVCVLASVASAQAAPYVPPVFDYAAVGSQVQTQIALSLTQVAPYAFGLLAMLLGFGIGWRYMKKGAKTS